MMSSTSPSAKIVLIGIAGHVLERKYGNRWLVRWDDKHRRLYGVRGCGIIQLVGFPYGSNEAKALALERPDQALFVAGIANRGAGRVEAGRKCRIGDNAASPYCGNQVALAGYAFSVPYQVDEKIECLRRNRNRIGSPMQLPLVNVKYKVLKQIAQSSGPDPTERNTA